MFTKKVFVGIGGNQGNSIQKLRRSLKCISMIPKVKIVSKSSLYLTEPVGFKKQPNFYNAVIRLETRLTPFTLLKKLLRIETFMRRKRHFKNSPRIIDLDLLLFSNYSKNFKGKSMLVLPHPRLHLRAFVLFPLVEISPNNIIPGIGLSRNYKKLCSGQKITRLKIPFDNSLIIKF
ncbi:MAG: 2-amino-4-hydroxy-6-hydroxymethyldihydropteridine diphosphokinase [Betaproteobacteria bacterium TMED82]|nr:MAG: 2-amino-4-hydroxy-6-hydroxymethyldihydropteridine diphosphokinase [Betaproteobacteria bacterium TMED82]|tara:strand:+ start:23916 stop:24443 length:528 start_codon:yes stop_codon:yes gene_type:complete